MAASTYAQQPVIPLYRRRAVFGERQTKRNFVSQSRQTSCIRNVTQLTLTAICRTQQGQRYGDYRRAGRRFYALAWKKKAPIWRVGCSARRRVLCAERSLMDTGTEEEYCERTAGTVRTTRPNSTTPATLPAPNPARRQAVEFAIADGAQAVILVRQRAAEWGIAPDRIGLMGFSAGGMLLWA